MSQKLQEHFLFTSIEKERKRERERDGERERERMKEIVLEKKC